MLKKRIILPFAFGLIVLATLTLFSPNLAHQAAHAQQSQHPRFTSIPMHKLAGSTHRMHPQIVDGGLPTWSSSFTSGGQSYPYTIVGTDPSQGSATSTISVDIVPLIFNFSDGSTSDGTTIANNIVNSPLFQNGSYNTGDTTQYVDAIQRAEFWNSVSSVSPDYHVLFAQPSVQPAVVLNVPAGSGNGSSSTGGNAQVDINWFSPQADNLATSSNNLFSSHLTIFAAYNVDMYQGNPSQCCIGGYHTAVQSGGGTYTYSYASYDDASAAFSDVAALSHELSEWANDPYVNNTVPSWSVPNQPQYGCSTSLEVGDPLVGSTFSVNGYTLQDEAYFSWFARENPSQGYNGQYDYLGNFSSYSSGC